MADKITKRDYYNVLRDLVENTEFTEDSEINTSNLLEFIDHEVELMNQRAAKSKLYQMEHKAENDAMTNMIYTILSNSETPMTIADLTNKIADATPQKIIYRLGQLFKNGYVAKDTQVIKTDNSSRKVTYYTTNAPATM